MVTGVSSVAVTESAETTGALLVPSAKTEKSAKARCSMPVRTSVPSGPETAAPPAPRVTV